MDFQLWLILVFLFLLTHFPWDPRCPTKRALIRPEDVEMYEDYIDTICFKEFDEDRISAFIRIYKEEKKWAGPLNMLIPLCR